ncbi:MAG TPA: hypothetical protein VKF32_13110 [Thermoanaerobaculia bacterium]|nr:hypothetical protein [Thermoanaerobaculia bacterium]
MPEVMEVIEMNKSSKFRLLIGAAALTCALGSSPASARVRVYVNVAPPAPIVEVHPAAPGPRHIWIDGYHAWNGTAYVWTPGRWDLPPRERARWVPGHWRHHGRHGWYWVEGHWR